MSKQAPPEKKAAPAIGQKAKIKFVPTSDKKVGKPVNIQKEAEKIVKTVVKAFTPPDQPAAVEKKASATLPPKAKPVGIGKAVKMPSGKYVKPKNPIQVEKKPVPEIQPHVAKKTEAPATASKSATIHTPIPAFGSLGKAMVKAREAVRTAAAKPVIADEKDDTASTTIAAASGSKFIDVAPVRKAAIPAKKVLPVAAGKVSFSDLITQHQAKVAAVPPLFDVKKYLK